MTEVNDSVALLVKVPFSGVEGDNQLMKSMTFVDISMVYMK